MKQCPKCGNQHNKPGTFCCRSCANSRGPRTEEFKEKVRKKLKGRKGKILVERIQQECEFCSQLFEKRKTSKQKYCCRECFLNYQETVRDSFSSYRSKCQFKFNVFDFPEEFDLMLIKEHGFYSPSNKKDNINGISRDHKISVSFGFKNGISPDIVSHPANCELMFHNLNSKKKTQCSISLEKLIDDIDIWNKKYKTA